MSDVAKEPVDLATVAADDALLSAVARGAATAGDDDVAAMLLAWRADLDEGAHDVSRNASLVGAALADGAGAPRRSRRLLGIAAAVVAAAALATGLVVGSDHAGPGNPLWPVTQVLHPQRAEVRAAEHAISQARAASAGGDQEQARRLLDQAQRHIARVDDPAVANRLTGEVTTLLQTLTASLPLPPVAVPGVTGQPTPASTGAAPTAPGGGAAPSAKPAPASAAPTGRPPQGSGGPRPVPQNSAELPPLPLPPLPTRSLPVLPPPTALPG